MLYMNEVWGQTNVTLGQLDAIFPSFSFIFLGIIPVIVIDRQIIPRLGWSSIVSGHCLFQGNRKRHTSSVTWQAKEFRVTDSLPASPAWLLFPWFGLLWRLLSVHEERKRRLTFSSCQVHWQWFPEGCKSNQEVYDIQGTLTMPFLSPQL